MNKLVDIMYWISIDMLVYKLFNIFVDNIVIGYKI